MPSLEKFVTRVEKTKQTKIKTLFSRKISPFLVNQAPLSDDDLRGLILREENQIFFKGLTPLTNGFFVVVVCYT